MSYQGGIYFLPDKLGRNFESTIKVDMKNYILLIILLLPLFLQGVTRTVALDGTQQYTSIQAAVNVSWFDDIILVYPGRYIENINLNGHNVTIASLYSQDPQQTYIDSTIIDGNLQTCIKAENGEAFTINGLTFVNNDNNTQFEFWGSGGALKLRNGSHLILSNCIIRNCFASYGGAISAGFSSIIEFSNVDIHSNRADEEGGGIVIGEDSQLLWDSQAPSKVYDNVAPIGMDFFIEDSTIPGNIQLSFGSSMLNNPDNYYIVYSGNNDPPTVSITQGYSTPIDHDIYVSPDGLDSNNGISSVTPFKTILHALQLITSNPDNPRTIHLAAGTYSMSANDQIFLIALKPYIRLSGAGSDVTILDGELQSSFFGAYRADGLVVSDMKLINARSSSIAPIIVEFSENVTVKNLNFENNCSSLSGGIAVVECCNVIIENVVAGDIEIENSVLTIDIVYCDNVIINKIISKNETIITDEENNMGICIEESDVVFRNSIIANNTAQDAYIFSYQNIHNYNADKTLDMSNVLIYNNNISFCSWAFSPVYIQNRYQPVKINNCTIAGNTGWGYFTKIFCYAEINNLISYNPLFQNEVVMVNHVYDEIYTHQYIDAEVSVNNSLFRTDSIGSSLPNLLTLTDNIFGGNPLFLGDVTDSLEVTDPEYYYLSAGSPCINSGTADTTGLNLPLTDLAGNYRVWNNRIDIGCYEYGSEHYVANEDPEYPPLPDKIAISLYPNPVYLNGSKGAYTFIEFTLPEKTKEKPVVEIYNLKGQKVRAMKLSESYNSLVRKAGISINNYELGIINDKLDNRITGKGACATGGEFYSTVFDCRDDRSQRLSAGIYIMKVTAGQYHSTTKMTILK